MISGIIITVILLQTGIIENNAPDAAKAAAKTAAIEKIQNKLTKGGAKDLVDRFLKRRGGAGGAGKKPTCKDFKGCSVYEKLKADGVCVGNPCKAEECCTIPSGTIFEILLEKIVEADGSKPLSTQTLQEKTDSLYGKDLNTLIEMLKKHIPNRLPQAIKTLQDFFNEYDKGADVSLKGFR